ncbi:uncharacterized protein LOC128757511 isoform X1 [Synchiropus splendidus]|uniref:uncharacterized protein LOC128757511 isoform X1 n=1 Tax=Synchiropus splendidus TaxID=270530 RepID=UPI00237E9355|nr:uncharacterized protein LOC128757511 isoform X1 [Synchiropus splendidus]
MAFGQCFVDGYAEVDGVKQVWEFYGCFFHGCPSCADPQAVCPLRGRPYGEFYSATMEREQTLKSNHEVRLITIWEHEWRSLQQSCDDLRDFLLDFDTPEPLNPRNALYGGRTSALKLRYTTKPGEKVFYADVTSLYPYVNSTCSYPLGHPRIIHKDFGDPRQYFGLIKAVVYPPTGLYVPVLPYRGPGGKLHFTLCSICSSRNAQDSDCTHSDDERALMGVWVSVEFNKALDKGYKVAKIIEVWHFDRSSDCIFAGYIRTFLKGKQEASGYPAEAVDQESRDKYIRDYQAHQGILLCADKVCHNPAKRQVAKACLNSLWGKFC